MRIAIAACRLEVDSPPTALYPDPDAPVLTDALLRAGASSVVVRSWDDPTVDWSAFEVVVVRSTWDSVDRPSEFLAWARTVEFLVNPFNVLSWCLDKVYLRDLVGAGLPVVPTLWVGPGEAVPPLPDGELVVKPSISAAGRSTTWHRMGALEVVRARVTALQAEGQTVMVQPYVASVQEVGETKCVFFGGEFSHAVRVGPLLERDVEVMHEPWEKVVSMEVVSLPQADLDVAGAVLTELARRFGVVPVYARVDLVRGSDGDPCILEVELIDPALFLARVDGAADRLAAAVLHQKGR